MAKRKWPIVEVEWEDSKGWPAWEHIDDIMESSAKERGLRQFTVGYLVHKYKSSVVVASSFADTECSDTVNGVMQIPRSAIRTLRILKEKSP